MPKDNERNKPVNTKAGLANYADKPPTIKPRQAEDEKRPRMAIAGPSDVETREERAGRRYQETEADNLNRSFKNEKNPVYEEQYKKLEEEKKRMDMLERIKEQKKYKKDPYGDA
jgi:hypothetical protein